MSNLFEQMEEAADAKAIPTDEALSGVGALAEKQLELEARIKKGEDFLKELKAEHRRISESELPTLMAEYSLTGLTLADGSKLAIQSYVSASIPKDRVHEAHQWLTEQGHGDLIKHTVSVSLGREPEEAERAVSALREQGFDPVDNEAVHHSTLKAFVKEQVEAGRPIPLELFGAYLGQKTTIKKG